ncbi:MAG TPA: dienelactone hydrolase family protein, partial [Longimicrobiales bacterium]|nr:dienelactone hydrolase family protein [Longimicrobiales bacterium]
MVTRLSFVLPLVLLAACASREPASDDHADHAAPSAAEVVSPVQDPNLPADEAGAQQRLDQSPRHGEWVMIPTATDSIRAWVVYPERATRAPVVLVVHEIYGVTHWIRGVADQLARDGFIAIAPDLMTAANVPAGPDGNPVRDQATAAIRALSPAVYQPQL